MGAACLHKWRRYPATSYSKARVISEHKTSYVLRNGPAEYTATLREGTLDEGRLKSYLKLQKERRYVERKDDVEMSQDYRQEVKRIHKQHKKIQSKKYEERGFK